MCTWHGMRGLFEQSHDYCAEQESKIWARTSKDGANLDFAYSTCCEAIK